MQIKILVVDDDVETCKMLSRHFRFLGFHTGTAENGQQALDKLAEEKWDIVIADIFMPVMDGIELLRTIGAHYPMVHVIMITGYVSLDNALTCMRLGADTTIFKPILDFKELETAVEAAVDSVKNWLGILNRLREMKPDATDAIEG